MGSLRQRGQYFTYRYRVDGRLQEVSLKTSEKSVARTMAAEIDKRVASGRFQLPKDIPVDAALEAFKQHLFAKRTHRSAHSDMGRLKRVFGDLGVKMLGQVSTATLQRYLDGRIQKDQLSRKTINEYRGILQTFYKYAHACLSYQPRDSANLNPAMSVQRHRIPAPEIIYLTLPDIEEQLKALESYADTRAAVATLIYAGLRRAELTWLTRDDIVLSGKTPHIRVQAKTIDGQFWQPKTGKNRQVPVFYALRAILQQHMARQNPEVAWAFPSPNGKRYQEDNFSSDLKKMQTQVGQKWTCAHYRHTFGSLLAQSGESLYKISRLMGNSPEICRRHYAHLSQESLDAVKDFTVPAAPSTPAPVIESIEKIRKLG